MKKHILSLFLLSMLFFSCKKPAGEGGSSIIKGTVWAEDWNASLTSLKYQYAAVDAEVYIIYGDDISYGDKTNTNANGEYEFKYLRKGSYKVYVISKEKVGTTGDTKDVAVEVSASITKNKQTVTAPQIIIKQ